MTNLTNTPAPVNQKTEPAKGSHTPDGGRAAFPLNTGNSPQPGAFAPHPGMLLRDYFAAHALAGIVASVDCYRAKLSAAEMAQGAFNVADEMLRVRTTAGSTGRTVTLPQREEEDQDPDGMS